MSPDSNEPSPAGDGGKAHALTVVFVADNVAINGRIEELTLHGHNDSVHRTITERRQRR